MDKKNLIIAGITLSILMGGWIYFSKGKSLPTPTETPDIVLGAKDTTQQAPTTLRADLYFNEPDCVPEGKFSILDVNVSDEEIRYIAPDNVEYTPAGDGEESITAKSVLREDGCFNYADPFEINVFDAVPAAPDISK